MPDILDRIKDIERRLSHLEATGISGLDGTDQTIKGSHDRLDALLGAGIAAPNGVVVASFNADMVDGAHLAAIMQWLSPAVKCAEATPETITNNHAEEIDFADADIFDTDSMHDPGVNPTRITFTTAGVYLIWGGGTFSSGSGSGFRCAYLRVDGVTEIPASRHTFRSSDVNDAPGLISVAMYKATAGQYVELVVFQNSGGNRTFSAQSFGAFRVAGA